MLENSARKTFKTVKNIVAKVFLPHPAVKIRSWKPLFLSTTVALKVAEINSR